MKTNICVSEKNCVYDKECQLNDDVRYISEEEKWCCTENSNCIKGNLGPLCLVCDNESGFFGEKGNCRKC